MPRLLKLLYASFILTLLALVGVALSAPADQSDGCPTPLALIPEQFVNTRPGVFVRNLPTISGGVVGYYENSVTFVVLEGPVCADGYNWWRVRTPGNPGWVAEGDEDFRLLFPAFSPNATPVCPAPLGYGAGAQVQTVDSSRVREAPSLAARVIDVLPPNTIVAVTGAERCAEGVIWLPVRFTFAQTSALVDGWLAEAQADAVFVVPPGYVASPTPPPCAPPSRRLEPGIRAVVTYSDFQPKNLRDAPSLSGAILYELLDGIAVDILDGPACGDGLNWWQVQVVGRPDAVGWVAEGGTAAGGFWLRPLIYD